MEEKYRANKIVPIKISKKLLKEFPEPKSQFPGNWDSVRFVGGRTIARVGVWHKAAILVQTERGLQIRFYGWNYSKNNSRWYAKQKYYVSEGSISKIYEVLDAYNLCLQEAKVPEKEEL